MRLRLLYFTLIILKILITIQAGIKTPLFYNTIKSKTKQNFQYIADKNNTIIQDLTLLNNTISNFTKQNITIIRSTFILDTNSTFCAENLNVFNSVIKLRPNSTLQIDDAINIQQSTVYLDANAVLNTNGFILQDSIIKIATNADIIIETSLQLSRSQINNVLYNQMVLNQTDLDDLIKK